MKRVLVVDNDKFFLEYLKGIISEMGHQVVTAKDGLYALDVLKSYSPDVIFVDLVMPNIDGKKLCKIIRGMPKVKDSFIAVLSGVAAEERETDIRELGADEYIAKGPDIGKSVAKVIEASSHPASKGQPSQEMENRKISSRRVTKELLSVKRHLEIILERMSEGILEVTYDGRIVYANPSALTFVNTPDDKLLGTNFIDLFTAADRKRVAEALNSLGGARAKVSYDSPVRLNGYEFTLEVYPVDEKSRSAIVILNDVTERKQWEKALRESKDLLVTFINSTNEAMLFIAKDGLITIFNSAAEKMFGRKKEGTIGQSFDCLVAESHKNQINSFFSEDWAGKVNGKIVEVPGLRSDGAIFPMEISMAPGVYGGKPFFVVMARDVTEQKAAEEEKWRLEAQLQYAQRMKIIGTLAGGVAHDFNNLLMAIMGNVEYMSYYIDSEEPYYQELTNIEKQVWRGERLTSQLLGFARMGRYNLKAVNLNQLIEESLETFRRSRKDIVIELEFAEDLVTVEADEEQILQSLMNLYLNAGDAMPGGGKLTVETKNVTHKHMMSEIVQPTPGDYVLLSVRDTGIGMDKETMGRVFDPFFTTKEVGKGTGLGLSSVYGIVKGHSGYIFVESEKGKGAAFNIYLPASEKSVEKHVETVEPLIKGKATVLIVDDEEMCLASETKMLEILGYTVMEAKSGQEAIDLFELKKDVIDIIILDVVMPEMNGIDVYRKISEHYPDAKVLLCSGYSMDEEWIGLLKNKYVAFLQKPFSLNELSRKVGDLLLKE